MGKRTDKQIDTLEDLVERLQGADLTADDLINAVKDEKYIEAKKIVEQGLYEVCSYLQDQGWDIGAIEAEAIAESKTS